MQILFTLCGRAGSKGVRGKNVRDFCGIPLIWYTLSTIALYCERFSDASDRVYVALNTDSEALVAIASRQTRVPLFVIERDAALAGDLASKISVVRDCLIRAEEHFPCAFDVVVDLDITSPLRTVEDVRAAILRKLERPETDVVFSVTHARRNPYFNMVRKEGDYYVKAIASDYTARQQAPTFFDMNASIYAYAPDALKSKPAATFFNDRADIVVMRETGILDIDSEEDYCLMQVIAQYLFDNEAPYRAIRTLAASWQSPLPE